MGSTFGADRRDRTLPKETFYKRLSGFSSLACNGPLLVRARRTRNPVPGAGFLLDSFHSTKGREKIRASRHHTVIGHEDGGRNPLDKSSEKSLFKSVTNHSEREQRGPAV